MNWRIQMRTHEEYQVIKHESKEFGTHYFLKNKWLDPDKVEVKARDTPMGERYYVRSKGWDKTSDLPREPVKEELTKDLF
jgi:hypothetical protein